MQNRKTKWLIYTVLVGLLPILSRLLVWAVTKEGSINIFSPSDFVAFGLVLHISNINEIEHFTNVEKEWKTAELNAAAATKKMNKTSISPIIVYNFYLLR